MMNPITEFTANQFLLFYGLVTAATLVVCLWKKRAFDPTVGLSVPPVSAHPDPYEIACLRGGESEVARVVIGGLVQRGYLRVNTWSDDRTTRIEQKPEHPSTSDLSTLERTAFDWFSQSRTDRELLQEVELAQLVTSHCLVYEEKLNSEQLLAGEEVQTRVIPMGVYGGALIAALGGTRILVGLMRDQPVGFLVVMAVLGLVCLFPICAVDRLSSRGQRYLEQVQENLDELKASTWRTTESSPFLLLLGVFGFSVLSGSEYGYLQDLFEAENSAAGGCGGGGDGGCGGCG